MVIQAAAYGPADNEYSAYFELFHQSIKADTHVSKSVAHTGYDETYGSKIAREKQSKTLLPGHRGPYQVLEKSHSIWLMENELLCTFITYDLTIMDITQPGHLDWISPSRTSRRTL